MRSSMSCAARALLKVGIFSLVPGGFGVRFDENAEASAAVVKAAPDLIVCDAESRAHH